MKFDVFQHNDIESNYFNLIDKFKNEIYSSSEIRIKQYGMLFKFITTNLKEINDMVNFDSSDQNIQVKGEKKFRDKTEELKNNSSVLNKIDEVNSYKVSSVSSSRIQKSNKDSHNSSNILKKCNSNSIHIENRVISFIK